MVVRPIKNAVNILVVVLAVVAGMGLPIFGYCDPLKFKPSVSVKQEYNDNVLFEDQVQEEDFITTVSPRFGIEQKDERFQATLSAGLDQIFYWDFDDLNALDMDARARVRLQTTERLGLGVSGSYSEDSRRDRETDLTGLVLAGDRDRTNVSVFSDYFINERTKATLTLGYSRDIIGMPDDEQSDSYKVDLAFTRNLSEWFDNTTGLLNFSYMNYSSDDKNQLFDSPVNGLTTELLQTYEFDLWQVYSGFSRNLTELLSVYVQAGLGYARSDEHVEQRIFITGNGSDLVAPSASESNESNINGVFVAGMNYNGLYYNAGLSVSHDARGASGVNGLVERTSVSADFSRKISSELTATLSGSCYLNRIDRTLGTNDDDLTLSVQTGLRYSISRDLLLSCYYRYRSLAEREIDTNRNQNLVYFMINKRFEL